jgi:predicted nucleic acid-binding protein
MPKSKSLKLIIDTSLWVSFIISNKQNVLDPFFLMKKQGFYLAQNLLPEFSRQ